MLKVNTVEQFHIMKWIHDNFVVGELQRIELISKNEVKITDCTGASAVITYDDKKEIRLVETMTQQNGGTDGKKEERD